MADFYQEMGEMVNELLSPSSSGGLGQGELVLVRPVDVSVPGDEHEFPPAQPALRWPLRGAATSVMTSMTGTEPISEYQMRTTDKSIIFAPFGSEVEYGDFLEIDGMSFVIKSIKRIPAMGIVAAWVVIVGS